MIKNYLKTAIRNIFRNRLTAFINIAGLALAMTSALMIYLYVHDEVSYDQHHEKADRIYRVTRDFRDQSGTVNLHLGHIAPPYGPLLKTDFGEIEHMARAYPFKLVMAIEENGERKKMTTETNVFAVEPDLFKILDIPVLSGNPAVSLERPLTVMLSEKAALKYFETTDCIGRHLKAGRRLDLEVTGVYKDFPPQTHWHPEFMMSFSTLNDSTIYGKRFLETGFGSNNFLTYVTLAEGTDPNKLEERFPEFIDKRMPASGNNLPQSKLTKLYLQKVTDIHLRSHLDSEAETNGNITNVYMMSVIGLFIILIACFNFVNLSTARASKRSKEVGLRKVAGAFRAQLVFQYLSESILTAMLGMALSIGLAEFALPYLNNFTGKGLVLNLVTNWPVTLGMLTFAVVVGILAGIYPAFVISSFKPAIVLKGQPGVVRGKGMIRKTLVVSQFAISIVLIIATAITLEQIGYFNSRDLGYDKDRVVGLPLYFELANNYDAFYNELTKSSLIKNAAQSTRRPTDRLLDYLSTGGIMKGDSIYDTGVILKYLETDYEFFDTYGIDIVAGRNFSRSVPTDDTLAYIINEAAVKQLGWRSNDEAVDQVLQYGGVTGSIIGVARDFHFESLHEEISPMVFIENRFGYNSLSVKISGGNIQEGIAHLQKVWREFLPIRPFDYTFISDQYSNLYSSEHKQSQLFTVFSGLAIFIACLGLFGLATFNTLQRIKEIGIRKVLGASVSTILLLLSKEIVSLILVANLIAWPVAWYLMGQWLSGFAYHIPINPVIFVGAAAAAVAIALLTVSIQTIRAAMTNPSRTLRYE